MEYINETAEAEGVDPRAELEKFVLGNRSSINYDEITETFPNLMAIDQDDWLKEFVRTNNPYDVLNCFFEEILQDLAEKEYGIPRSEEDIVGEMIYKLGFKKRVQPMGLSQIRAKLEQSQGNFLKMVEVMDELLRKLFLFYSYTLRWFALERTDPNSSSKEMDALDTAKEGNMTGAAKKADPIETIENLLQQYRRKTAKSLGDLYLWLRKLMEVVSMDQELISYCQRHFQLDVPLNSSQIAEIGMFRTYRNLVGSGHSLDSDSWERHKERACSDLSNMDSTIRNMWQGSWDYVRRMYDTNKSLPESAMKQRMATFFYQFLNSLSESSIYPKVIVMREYSIDEYGTFKVYADSSDPNEAVVLTDCGFDPFTEFYYHSRTNPAGIEPILITKKELEDWGIQSYDDSETQEEI